MQLTLIHKLDKIYFTVPKHSTLNAGYSYTPELQVSCVQFHCHRAYPTTTAVAQNFILTLLQHDGKGRV
jgi:hypothetical protein